MEITIYVQEGSRMHQTQSFSFCGPKPHAVTIGAIAVIDVTKSRTGNYDFCACARARGFPGRTLFGRTHTLRRVCRAITRLRKCHPDKIHIDHDHLSTQVIQIPSKSKTSLSSSFIF